MCRGANKRFYGNKRLAFAIAILFSTIAPAVFSQESIRPGSCVGIYYPSDPVKLSSQIRSFIKFAQKPFGAHGTFALIVPNAPFMYIGSMLASAYSSVSGITFEYVVILGADETAEIPTIYAKSPLKTPLGRVPSADDLAKNLLSSRPRGYELARADSPLPASIECQLPFVQFLFGGRPVLAIGVSSIKYFEPETLAKDIYSVISGHNVLFICSANLSLSQPAGIVKAHDQNAIALINSLSPRELETFIESGSLKIESSGAILTTLYFSILAGAGRCATVRYMHSGEISGEKKNVKGFFSAIIAKGKAQESPTEPIISTEEGKVLLAIARNAVDRAIGYGGEPIRIIPTTDILSRKAGVFIFINSDGKYRGAIGNIFPTEPLNRLVEKTARIAVSCDPRFSAISPEEAKNLKIKLSILKGNRRIHGSSEFNKYNNGLLVKRGGFSATMLPSEMDPALSNDEILERLCIRAGMRSGCWRFPDCELWAFEVQEFSE